jgi:4-amino-4-deoxy-L-arabinose transferase-like glycosyltransferase
VVFHFTGVSLVATRCLVLAIFIANLVLAYLLVRTQASSWAALLSVTILVTNAFLYAFSRVAILEPLLLCLLLLSWLLALRVPRLSASNARYTLFVSLGLLLCLMVLTKTTAVFLFPSVLFLIWHGYGYKFRQALAPLLTVAFSAAVPWAAYYFFFVRPHYLFDYHYLFVANQWEQPTTIAGWIITFWYAVHGALWIDPMLCCVGVALLLLSLLTNRDLRRNPLLIASLLAAGGYIFFTGWHNNMEPRYYEVVAFPLAFIVSLSLAALVDAQRHTPKYVQLRLLIAAASLLITVSTFDNLRQVFHYVTHPEYTFLNAAQDITHYIDQHPNGNRLLLSISGDNITLMTHLPAICDDFGTWDLPMRIHTYHPGWFATWNEIDPGTLEDLQTQYTVERVASFHAFDDEDRNLLILYKLHPLKQTPDYDQAFEMHANIGK